MHLHARDKRKYFAVNFGNNPGSLPPLVFPLIFVALALPMLICALIAIAAFDHSGAGVVLAISPIVIATDRIGELQKRIAALMDEYDAIKKKAKEESRLLTPEENSRCATLQKEVLAMRGEVNLEQDEIEMRETLNQPMRSPVRPAVETEDELQRRYAQRGVRLPPKEKRFGQFGEFVGAVIKADPRMDGRVDPRLIRSAAGMGENVPADGGFLVQADQSDRLIEPLFNENSGDAVLTRVNQTTVTGDGLTFNAIDETTRATSNWGGIIMYWLDEGSVKTPSAPKLRKVELKLKKIAGLCYLTDELIRDAAALSSRLERGFRGALRSMILRAIVRGTGAGQPLGLLNSSAKIPVAAETGQQAATIVTENVVKMFSRLDPDAVNPVWLYNRIAFPQLYQLQVALGAAGALVNLPNGGIAVQPNTTLLGLPLIPCPWCSVLGTEGDLMLVDLGQYEFINQGGPDIAYSIHVRFLYDETAMRIVYRCDGRPAVISATTLEDGSTTVSPIITLATRS
jgi:HK97 family phage major capsid protein